MLSRCVWSYFRRYILNDNTLPKKCYIKYVNKHHLEISKECECKYVCKFENRHWDSNPKPPVS